jgi:hypothetical protein
VVDEFVHSLAAGTVDVATLDAEVVLEAEVRHFEAMVVVCESGRRYCCVGYA